MGGGGEDESENERIPDQVKCRWTMIDDYKSFDKIRQEGEQNLKRWHLRGAVSMGYERNGSQPLSRTTPQPQPHLPLTASQQTFVYIYCSCPIRVKDRSCFFGSRLLMAVFCRLWVVIILWICYNILQLAEARIYIFLVRERQRSSDFGGLIMRKTTNREYKQLSITAYMGVNAPF